MRECPQIRTAAPVTVNSRMLILGEIETLMGGADMALVEQATVQ